MDIYKVLAYCWYKTVSKEMLEAEMKKIENHEWEVFEVYQYVNILIDKFPILDELEFGTQFDIISYYNSWGKTHQWFSRKRKWVKRSDFNSYMSMLDFISEDKARLQHFMLIYVSLYLLG